MNKSEYGWIKPRVRCRCRGGINEIYTILEVNKKESFARLDKNGRLQPFHQLIQLEKDEIVMEYISFHGHGWIGNRMKQFSVIGKTELYQMIDQLLKENAIEITFWIS
jgi:hypothetical protein